MAGNHSDIVVVQRELDTPNVRLSYRFAYGRGEQSIALSSLTVNHGLSGGVALFYL